MDDPAFTAEAFRRFCARTSLRKRGRGEEVISPTRSRKHPHDHLFPTDEPEIGVAIRRDTRKAKTYTVKALEGLGCWVTQDGDTEANLRCPRGQELAVARFLKCNKVGT